MGEVGGESKGKFGFPEGYFLVVTKVSLPNYLYNCPGWFWLKFWTLKWKNMQTVYSLKVSKMEDKERSNSVGQGGGGIMI